MQVIFPREGKTIRKAVGEEVNYQMNSSSPVGALSLPVVLCSSSGSLQKYEMIGMRMQIGQSRVLYFRGVGYS